MRLRNRHGPPYAHEFDVLFVGVSRQFSSAAKIENETFAVEQRKDSHCDYYDYFRVECAHAYEIFGI